MLLFGPPGTGKTLCTQAVANRTDVTFIRATSIFYVPAHDKTTGKLNCIIITVSKGRLEGGGRTLHGSGCREANRGPGYFYLCIFVLTCIDPKAYFDNSNKLMSS